MRTASSAYCGKTSELSEALMWHIGTGMPAVLSCSAPASSFRYCASQTPALPGHAKWENAPVTWIHSCAALSSPISAASSSPGSTPMRCIPVSSLICTFSGLLCALQSSASSGTMPRRETVTVRSHSTAGAYWNGSVLPMIRMP